MTVTEVTTQRFRYTSRIVRDADGHTHPGPEREATQVLLRIATDEGAEGYSFGTNPQVIDGIVRPALLGEDPFYRERIWQDLKKRQRLHLGSLSDTTAVRNPSGASSRSSASTGSRNRWPSTASPPTSGSRTNWTFP